MKMKITFTSTVLPFIYCLKFAFAGSGDSELPDNGRIKIAECLREFLSADSKLDIQSTDPVEIVYEKLCRVTLKNVEEIPKSYFGDKRGSIPINQGGEDENAEKIMKNCLKIKITQSIFYDENLSPDPETLVDNLFNRYKKSAPSKSKDKDNNLNENSKDMSDDNRNKPTVSAFTQFLEGYCSVPEVVKFDDLRSSFQLETINCLKECAVKLFKALEKRIAELDPTIKAEKKAEDFDSKCQKNETYDIRSLSNTGKEWLKKYDEALTEAYENNKDDKKPNIKSRVKDDFAAYYLCAEFVCAMRKKDTPFDRWITEEIDLMNGLIVI